MIKRITCFIRDHLWNDYRPINPGGYGLWCGRCGVRWRPPRLTFRTIISSQQELNMGERLRVIWQAIRAGMGLGPRRDISAEARVKRVLEASRDRVEESVRRGEQQLREGRTTSLDDLTQIPQVIGKQRNVIGVERKP